MGGIGLLERLTLAWGARLPLVLQTEAAECGLACLAMVSGFHGRLWDMAELRRRIPVSLKGVNLKKLVAMAGRLGFSSRSIRVELEELPLVKTPCILHWDLNHFVVLKGFSAGRAVIHDPAAGVRRLRMSEVSRHFTGVALELDPLGGFESAAPPPRVRLSRVLGRIVGLKRSLAQVLALALAIEVFVVAAPLFLQWVVDHALLSADRDLLLVLAAGFGLLLLLRVAFSMLRGWVLMGMGASLRVQGRANLFSHLASLPAGFFEARHLGDIVSRFGSQDAILQGITAEAVEAVLDGLLALVTLAIMALFSPLLAAVVAAGAALYGLARWAFYAPLRDASAEGIVLAARRDSHFLETLRGVKTVKLFNAQGARRAHWLGLLVEALNRSLDVQRLRLGFRNLNLLLLGSLAILVVWLGAHRVLDNDMSIGMLLAFLAYKDQFLGRVSALIDRSVELKMLRLHAERLADIALAEPEPRDEAVLDEESSLPVALSVEVRELAFRYGENEPWVLHGLSFRVEPGETVAVVGASGCGKSTLLKILASLLAPTRGEVLVDGRPLVQHGIARWRASIGVVMQDDQLFAGSIADNICFFDERPDAGRIEDCARLACVHDDIIAMPMGYQTLIGDMGAVLSGGEKQRVLIARALYRRPSVLLLDEATSHLDVATERALAAALRELEATRILIAHRPETVRSADRIISLDGRRGGVSAAVVEKRPAELAAP
jgi:ATP-binding cassette subfamily B protein RaxB